MKFKPSSIIIYIREDMETTCVHQHMNELKHMVHRHNGILFDLKKKENFIIGNKMDGPRRQC